MISPEEAQGAAAQVFYILNMPGGISVELSDLATTDGGHAIRVTGIVNGTPEDFTFECGIENNEHMNKPLFTQWLLGWAMATLSMVSKLDREAELLGHGGEVVTATRH